MTLCHPIRTWLGAALCAGGAFSPAAFAQTDYPTRPISIVSPFAAGGTSDLVARLIAPKLSATLGKPVIVENRAGAAGNIGASFVARAKPDGHTLLLGNNVLVTNPATQPVPYDAERDFAPIALLGAIPIALAVHPSIPANTVADLVKIVKASPSKTFGYSSCGAGTAQHLAGEMLKNQANIPLVHIAYKGCSLAVVDGISGQVPIMFNAISNLMPYAQSGQLKILAVASSARFSGDQRVQTMAEAGFKNFDAEVWFGLLAPAGTPPDVVARLQTAVTDAMNAPDVKAKLDSLYFETRVRDGAFFKTYLVDDLNKWKAVVKEAKIEVTP